MRVPLDAIGGCRSGLTDMLPFPYMVASLNKFRTPCGAEWLSWLEQRNHNPRVGGSSPSSATNSPNIINPLFCTWTRLRSVLWINTHH